MNEEEVLVNCSVCKGGNTLEETSYPCVHLNLCRACQERFNNPASPLSLYCDVCEKVVSVKHRHQDTFCCGC